MSKKHIFLLLIFAFLSFTQKSYAQDLPLSTQKPPVAEPSASSLIKLPADSTSAASADSSASSVIKPRVAEPSASSVSKVPADSTSAASTNSSASSVSKVPADSTSAASADSSVASTNPITQDQISDASTAVSTEEQPVTNPTAASADSSATLSTKDATQTKSSPLSTQDQISDASTSVSTQKPPVAEPSASSLIKLPADSTSTASADSSVASTNPTATSTSQNQTSENEIPKFPNKSQEAKEKQESFVGKNIFSFELAYLRNALKNNGWGIGLSFEQSLFQFFSVKGRFSHVTMFPKDLDFNITTVGIGAEILFYPFRNGLDKLYFGFGNETDFYMYLSSSPENSKDTIITIYPKIGWKQNFFNLVFLDLFVSYNFFLSEVPTLSSNINLLERGINYGAKFKFNLSEIWTFVKKSFSS